MEKLANSMAELMEELPLSMEELMEELNESMEELMQELAWEPKLKHDRSDRVLGAMEELAKAMKELAFRDVMPSNMVPKPIKNSITNSIKTMMPFKIDFCMDFGGFCEAKCNQVGTTMGSKFDII